jgi:hypothetical protein
MLPSFWWFSIGTASCAPFSSRSITRCCWHLKTWPHMHGRSKRFKRSLGPPASGSSPPWCWYREWIGHISMSWHGWSTSTSSRWRSAVSCQSRRSPSWRESLPCFCGASRSFTQRRTRCSIECLSTSWRSKTSPRRPLQTTTTLRAQTPATPAEMGSQGPSTPPCNLGHTSIVSHRTG